jgi:hypothetical protein
MVITIKWWMEYANMTNGIFLILKSYDLAYQLRKKKKKKKILTQINSISF